VQGLEFKPQYSRERKRERERERERESFKNNIT
jgi:hypothetical protein